ncbi:MAG: hypothetical protein O9272_16790 [Brevundimonas sp.]|nr:hypothetical protein [Brevundimonas sp.]
MTDERGAGLPIEAAITSDVGANLVLVLVILLVALGLQGAASPDPSTAQFNPALVSVPLSGKEQSDVLHARLWSRDDVLVVELTADGAFVPDGERMMPLSDLGRAWPKVAAVFIFSAAHYSSFRDIAAAEPVQLVEVTVPQVLRRQRAAAGHSEFNSAFLGIRAGPDPASIRPPLLRLLQSGPAAAVGVDPFGSTGQPTPQSSLSFLAKWLRLGINLFLLCVAALLLIALRRRMA